MKSTRILLGAGALLALATAMTPATAQSGDAANGRTLTWQCEGCHGPLGVSADAKAPHLAGMPAKYAEAQLRAFRDGSRKSEEMLKVVRALSDEDMADLAAFYASIKLEARLP
jgi:cytochrome c553